MVLKQAAKGATQLGMLREPQVLELVPVSAATLWRMVKDGTFPRPRRISQRAVAWQRSDVEQWINTREEVGHDEE